MATIRKVGNQVVLEGVRKISWETGEMCEFASSLVSTMDCLGESIPYHYVMGISGVAFRLHSILENGILEITGSVISQTIRMNLFAGHSRRLAMHMPSMRKAPGRQIP